MRTKRMLAAALLAVVALVAQPATVTAQDGTRTGAPGEVVDLQVSATSDRVTVSWGEPATGGAPTRYKVNLKPVDGGRGKVKNPKAPKTSVTYSNLDAGETYRVWVRALNDDGKGPKVHYGENIALLPSAQAPAEVQGGSGDPQPQQQEVLDATIGRPAINLMHTIHNGFQVYWYAPQGLSDRVTGYDLQYRDYDEDSSTWGNWSDAGHTGTDTFLLLTGLKAETRYETRVRAWIGNRYSRWSLHRSSVNKAYTKNHQDDGRPDPPTVPTATAGAGRVTVSWTDPGTANNSVAITAYKVAWRSGSDITYSSKLPATTTSYDIVGLAANTSYEVWVKAYGATRGGTARSASSPTVEVVTLNPPPPTTTLPPTTTTTTLPPQTTTLQQTTTLPSPVFDADADNFDWRIYDYTVGQAAPLRIGPLPTATGGTGTLTYSVEGVTSCNRGDAVDGDGCGRAHQYNEDGTALVDWEAAGFSYDAESRVLSSNTGADAPTAAKVLGAVSPQQTEAVYLLPEGQTVPAGYEMYARTSRGDSTIYVGGRYELSARGQPGDANYRAAGWYAFLAGEMVLLTEVPARTKVTALPVTIPVWYTVTDEAGQKDRITLRITVSQ